MRAESSTVQTWAQPILSSRTGLWAEKKQKKSRSPVWTPQAKTSKSTYRKSSVRRAIMNRQMRRAVQLVFGFLLSFGPWSLPAVFASVACTQFAIQTISPSNTTIVSAIPQSDPVPYCEVLGYVTTLHPGPNQVNFELNLPTLGNGRFLFIGNGAFADRKSTRLNSSHQIISYAG